MSIQIYNSLSKKLEDLVPLSGKTIRMYSCGVTVYDKCHLGHARSLYIFDVIRRYLKFRGYDVYFVRNITDIDDKIINRANDLGKTSEEVSTQNIKDYYDDMNRLGVEKADIEPRATENIAEMIKYISTLIADGYAYESQGDVYFNVRKFPDYGKLSGQSVEHMREAVRIDKGDKKHDPLDFALWKKSKEGEPFWDSPWGAGRPGWHIECSCMSLKHLQCETLDIHAGGRDLIFPHHENEIAQSEAYTKKPFAKYWIHHGLLTIDGQKMAKSLGNFITVEDALKKYPVDDVKIFFLMSAYGSAIDFTQEKMLEAHKAIERFDILFWKASHILEKYSTLKMISVDFVERHKADFIAAMDDDFNTPKALAALFNFLAETNRFIESQQENPQFADTVYTAVETIESLGREVLGLFLREPQIKLSPDEEQLLQARTLARQNKDFKKADELRDALKAKGIIVEDTKDGQTWRFA
ncbi:MAG: cysteine--tRNA ligase [Candidatus Omnitrophica bacterium]|nr:cysteine--tRNA ligase [Candidatus Omnitrophota bacterium]